eukprot:Gb_37942 [translate_table: standard]
MAEGTLDVARFPQGNYVDALRWLPPVAAFDRLLAVAIYDADSGSSSIQINTLTKQNPIDCSRLELQTSWTSPARISSLKVGPSAHKAIIAASSRSGYLSFLVADPLQASLEAESSLVGQSLHRGAISGMDLQASTCECVSVGEDGKINLVKLAEAQLQHRCVFDNRGLVSYTAACWASPMEFVTAALGFSLQWWDNRKPGGPVSQSPKKWIGGSTTGMIHSIDVHPSRKHVCVVGGSSGSLFAWDLRWQQEPIPLAGIGSSNRQIAGVLSESEVWEVKYDHYTQSAGLGAVSSKIPPVMMCSEDGILAVFESGDAPLEVLAEPCAINTFDIDPENSSDVICGLEWETVLFFSRS